VGADGPGSRAAHHLRGGARLTLPEDARERLALLDAVVAALAHPARRQILLTVHFRGGEATSGEIAGRFAHRWPTTTRHLRVLEKAGLLRQEQRGRARIYRIDRERLTLVSQWLAWFGVGSPPS
jgi:DNA-binding transcriptional ArsR family regulator